MFSLKVILSVLVKETSVASSAGSSKVITGGRPSRVVKVHSEDNVIPTNGFPEISVKAPLATNT